MNNEKIDEAKIKLNHYHSNRNRKMAKGKTKGPILNSQKTSQSIRIISVRPRRYYTDRHKED